MFIIFFDLSKKRFIYKKNNKIKQIKYKQSVKIMFMHKLMRKLEGQINNVFLKNLFF